ncbi:thioredoxin domain-containing protein [Flavobacterium sp. Fl-318]|uniref:Thioredoxin domain-containing protein n=1 Tax=Flavobacterium cupriresistens TaxID=2893885 RepID=A0ABU4RBN0_9FLAO|nr:MULTISPECIES: thioredoxin domain-containing protein [unclassified Flavobacterium]MDX6189997.1 thioredoxin domain-containing protein [Flavobacterium sp. Fl-318]UFH42821.1 thioredoxin domain-containing protein [Flavobacterium sp. F-323]
MKFFSTLLLLTVFTITSCNQKQTNSFEEISPKVFTEKIKTTENPQILDVRTPDEFASEHIDNAINVNWNDEDFATKAATYDKSKPVFVYCLSGGRSKKAAAKLNELGFTTVYELEGGIMSWNAEGLSKPSTAQIGMTQDDFNKLLNTDKKVLVDFYAEWCGPCKQMEPYLLKMQKEMGDQVTIIRIDVDKNKTLTTEMKIDQLPTMFLYEKKEVKWRNVGFISEQDLKKQLQ